MFKIGRKIPVDKEQCPPKVAMQSERQVDDFESAIVCSRADREISLKWVNIERGQESTTISLKSVLKCC